MPTTRGDLRDIAQTVWQRRAGAPCGDMTVAMHGETLTLAGSQRDHVGKCGNHGISCGICPPGDDRLHRRGDDGTEQHLVDLSRDHRIRSGGQSLVRRNLLKFVVAIIEPDAQADIGVVQRGGGKSRHVGQRGIAQQD